MVTKNTGFDYDNAKARFNEYAERNKSLILNDPLSTREKIRDKIIQTLKNPMQTHDFVVRCAEGKNKLFKKKRSKYLEVISVDEIFEVLSNSAMRDNICPSYRVISEEYYVPMFAVLWFQEIWRGPVKHVPTGEHETVTSIDIRTEIKIRNAKRRIERRKIENTKQEKVKKVNKDPSNVWRLSIIEGSSVLKNCDDERNRVDYLLILKEDHTNFLLLKPFFECNEELALELSNIFAEYGYPDKVYAKHLLNLCQNIFKLVREIDPKFKVSVQRSSRVVFFRRDETEVLDEIHKCMEKQQTDDIYWDQCCHIVQYKLNMTERVFTSMETKEECSGIPYYLFHNSRSTTIDPYDGNPSEIKSEVLSISDNEMDEDFH